MGKKFFWFFAFLLMTVNSFLAAELLRTKVNTKLETLAELNLSSDTQTKSKGSKGNYTDYQIINERNMFQTAKPEDKKEAEKSSEPVPPPPKPLTELKLKLLGTMVGIASPRAIILNLKTNNQFVKI